MYRILNCSNKFSSLYTSGPGPLWKMTLPQHSWWFCVRTNKIERLCKNGWFLPAKTIVRWGENQADYHILPKLFPRQNLIFLQCLTSDNDLRQTIGYIGKQVIYTATLSLWDLRFFYHIRIPSLGNSKWFFFLHPTVLEQPALFKQAGYWITHPSQLCNPVHLPQSNIFTPNALPTMHPTIHSPELRGEGAVHSIILYNCYSIR